MKKDIILAGVGGQGIVSIAATIGTAALKAGLNLKQSEVHGMSQRGGDVMSHLRVSDKEIASDLVPLGKADLIISVEPMEALRYLPYLSENGYLITNTTTFKNIPEYPTDDAVLAEVSKVKNHVALNADAIAKELGSSRMANIVVLGAATPFLGMDIEVLKDALRSMFGKKGDDVVNSNIKALEAGFEVASKKL